MNKTDILIVALTVIVPLAAGVWVKWWMVMNSRDGERYMKQRMQGPMVPLSAEEVAEDEARKSQPRPD